MEDKFRTKEQLLNQLAELGQRNTELERSLTDLRQAEEHIRYLATLPDLNPNPVIEVNSSGKITFFNRAAEKALEELGMDKGDIKAILPKDLTTVLRDLSTKSKPTLSREVIIKDRVFSETICFTPLYNAAFIYVTDITELRRSEKQTTKLSSLKEQLLGTIRLGEKLKLITDGIVEIFGADFARIWMTKDGDLCEKGCPHATATEGQEVCRDQTRCLHLIASSGRYNRTDGTHHRVPLGCYKIGRVASGQDSYFVTNDVTGDPRVHDHEWAKNLGLMSFAGYRLLSAEGKPIGVLALFSKKPILAPEETLLEDLANSASHVILAWTAQEKLRESEEKYRAIVETFSGMIYTCSEDYRIEFMNEAFIKRTGYDATGESCYKVLHGLDSVCPWCPNDRVFKGKTVRFEVLSPLDNRWYYIVNTPIYHADGAKSKHSMILDITERKQAEAKIRDLNQELAQRVKELKVTNEGLRTFSYSLSHDLRTPLVAIKGFSRRLLEKYAPHLDEKGQHYLKAINGSSIKMEKLIGDLLVFFGSGTKTIKRSTVKMDDTVQEIVHQLRGLHPDRTIQLNIKTLPDAKGDGTMIGYVLTNLLHNAVKFSRSRDITVIEVAGWIEKERNVYYVKDNGIGFPMEQADKIFEAFKRLHTAEEIEGTGLGLAIVKRIIHRHGGNVWAKARVDKGATFYFSVPR
jgi:signal transduction histidine kinase